MAILVISPKEVYATARLKEEFKKAGLTGVFFDVNDLAARRFSVKLSKYSGLYIRQAYPYQTAITELALRFAHSRKPIVDANIIRATQDSGKWGVYQTLMQHGVSIPQTVLLSSRSASQDDTRACPYILKWIYGFGGQHVYLIKTKEDAHRVLQKYPPEQLLVQEFIEAQYEYKVMTVGYTSLPVVLKIKTSGSSFRPDFKNYTVCHPELDSGSSMNDRTILDSSFRWNDTTQKVVALAERAARVLGRELAKVDILEDQRGNLFVLEVNRWPGFQNFEKLTGYNVAGEFVRYLQKKLK
jgi:glutathione synthase/RimK-type ligase-like ATP-grasp enzyme